MKGGGQRFTPPIFVSTEAWRPRAASACPQASLGLHRLEQCQQDTRLVPAESNMAAANQFMPSGVKVYVRIKEIPKSLEQVDPILRIVQIVWQDPKL